ncbi:SLATT domain-containing protein [Cedecea sp. MMO-103]|uniref:SLATT domain-containing protein n=1 Tax=Cedecea sp. MMO-103 TaxID=3081238 RepID=UPI00301A145D
MPFDQKHYEKVEKEMERHREDTETSKLGHWCAAAKYERRHKLYIGLPATTISIFLTWLLSSDAKDVLAGTSYLQPLLVFLGLIVSILSGLGTFLNFNEQALKHRSAAESLHALWRDCKNWDTDFPDMNCCKEAVLAVQNYRKRLNDINRDAPQIPKWAWKSVNKQRAEGSTTYKNEELKTKISKP